MFIPNKTVNLIKTSALLVLSALVVVIVGQAVLYIKMSSDTNKKMDHFVSQMDSLGIATKKFDTLSFKKHQSAETRITNAATNITMLETKVTELEQSVNLLKMSTDMLIVNECKVMPYYMDKSLMTTCKSKGF